MNADPAIVDDKFELIAGSNLFEHDWYLRVNRDVANAEMDPLQHYLLYGASEGRNPNPLFDTNWYRSTYPEVAADGRNPLLYYLEEGAAKGHSTHPSYPISLFPGRRTGCSATELTPLGEVLCAFNTIDHSALFERDWYLITYADVAASGSDPLWHYIFHGVAEGRNPNRLFDTRWYLSAYPEVAAKGSNPLDHYIREGEACGYDPHPFFPRELYLRRSPIENSSRTNRLEHFLYRVLRRDPDAFPRFSAYDVHRATQDNVRRHAYPAFVRHIEVMSFKPLFVVFIDGGDEVAIKATAVSLERQLYRGFLQTTTKRDVVVTGHGDRTEGTYVLWLDAGDTLDPDALYELASAINADLEVDMIYFDHDVVADDGLSSPIHKPNWSPDYFEASNYIDSAACFDSARFAQHFSHANGRYDFMLRFTEAKMRITRVDRILLHKTSQLCLVSPADEATDILALNGRLERTGRTGRAQPVVSGSGCYELSVALCASPLVSIVIPTAARVIDYEGRRIDLVAQCLETIIARSTYKNIEFIIIDNGDFDRDRIAHISLQKITFLTYSLPEINIAKKINLGASRASGSVILILNDDVVPIAPDWIERMLAHLEKPHVGVVGAKLLYPNDTFQHVGVVVCDGLPEHVRRGWPRADEGYAFSSVSVRNYLAVTGAVSMVRREHFKHVGGYSEDLPIDYNDIDFSYKLANAGFTVVFEPRAELYHYESVSVVKPVELHDAMRFAKKWAVIPDDPFYDQYCFSKHPATYKLSYSERKY